MRPVLLAAAVLAVSLAGCSDAPAADAGDGVQVGAGEVLLEGVVVDAAIRPVPGAKVTAQAAGAAAAEATTGDDGAFAFALPPGAAVLEASHSAYAPVRHTVQLLDGAGANPRVVLQFSFAASEAPYATVAKFDGFIVCSLGLSVVFSEECGAGVGTPVGRVGEQGNNAIRFDFQPDSPSLKTAIVEQAWTPTSEAGRQLAVVFATGWTCEPACGGEAVGEGSVQGSSPLLLRADEADLADHLADPASVYTTYTLALTDTVAANVVLNQPFQLFVSLFYREPAPEGHSFVGASA